MFDAKLLIGETYFIVKVLLHIVSDTRRLLVVPVFALPCVGMMSDVNKAGYIPAVKHDIFRHIFQQKDPRT